MKFLIATDVHGSAYWAEKVVQKFYQTNADKLVLLGDVYNHGPRNPFPKDYAPMRVAELFNGIADKIIAVQGNCDSEVDQMISQFEILRENVLFLGDRRLFLTHGHVHNKHNVPALSKSDVLFYGHFHVCEIVDVDGVVCVNVGSCALPKDSKNCFCTVDDKQIAIFDFDDNELMSYNF